MLFARLIIYLLLSFTKWILQNVITHVLVQMYSGHVIFPALVPTNPCQSLHPNQAILCNSPTIPLLAYSQTLPSNHQMSYSFLQKLLPKYLP